MQLLIYGVYLFFAVFNAGNMTTLQLQHYKIYPFVGPENFKNYMKANNRSALIPSIFPGIILLIINVILLFYRPQFMPVIAVEISMVLNLVAMLSTFSMQRKVQADMAMTGYNKEKIKLLVSTNWIRTIVFLIQAIMAVCITMQALK